MKRKIFSKLLMVAMLIASVSSFVSCKDYDDDINNLQDQINKAALQSELAALQQTVANNATAAKAAADAAEAAAKKYADELAAKSTAKADDLEKLIAQVKAVADAAATKDDLGKVEEIAKAAATQAALTEAIAELNGAIEKVKAVADAAATKEELAKAQEELKAAIKKVEAAAAEAKTLAQKAQETADKANTDLAAEVKRAKEAEEKLDAAIKKALEDAKKYTDDALTASKKYTDDEVAKAAAKAADELAKAIAKVYTKTEVDEKIADAKTEAAADAATKLANALGDLGTATVKDYVNTQIGSEVADLKEELADTYLTKADFEKITGVSGSLTASVNALYTAVTSVELFGSYCGFGQTRDNVNARYLTLYRDGGLVLSMLHGFVGENSTFGDDETDCGTVANPFKYVKDADIKSAQGIVVRVNPVNADLTDAKIILVNSKGEGLDDYVEAGTPVRYTQLITTRGTDINTGLWIIPFSVKDGIDEEALVAKTQVLDKDGKPVLNRHNEPLFILQAIAIKNTDGSEYGDEEDSRYVTSTFDVAPYYVEYEPATTFFFNVEDRSVVNIRNRWYDASRTNAQYLDIVAEQKWKSVDYDKYLYPELAWKQFQNEDGDWVWDLKPSFSYELDENDREFLDKGIGRDQEDRRSRIDGYSLLPVKVDVPFTIANVYQAYVDPTDPIYNDGYNKIEYYYVALDCHNAIESSPSEINAWESYNYDGLYTRVSADEPLQITIHNGAKSIATGDVIGFRVFAVNYDGTLADPDGKAFYVYVGDDKSAGDLGAATITATSTETLADDIDPDKVLQSTAISIKSDAFSFVSDYWYNIEIANNNRGTIVDGTEIVEGNILPYFRFVFYDSKGKIIKDNNTPIVIEPDQNGNIGFPGAVLSKAVTMKVIANIDDAHNIYNLVDDNTYSFVITGGESLADQDDFINRQTFTFTVQKLLPTQVKLPTFRPKQNVANTNQFIAYMVPDSIAASETVAAHWNTGVQIFDQENKIFNTNNTKMWGSYTAKGVNEWNVKGRIHGFKDLNNIFYNLDLDKNYRFIFKTTWNDKTNVLHADAATDNLPLVVDYKKPTNVQWVNPVVAEYAASYILNVTSDKIDGETSHNIDLNYKYARVSTKLDEDGDFNAALYAQDHYAKSENAFSVIYKTWIQASTFTNNGLGNLQWKATDLKVDTLDLSKIKATNSYNADEFGPDVNALLAKKYLYPTGEVKFSTDSIPVATSQINPYFKPVAAAAGTGTASATSGAYKRIGGDQSPIIEVTSGPHKGHVCVLVTQKSVQADAAPNDNHFEYFVVEFNDAFGFKQSVSAKVQIKKPTTNARKH